MLVNEANANYKKQTIKNEYSDDELKQIGKATVKVIEVTKRLPTIIEQNLYDIFDMYGGVIEGIRQQFRWGPCFKESSN